MTSLNAENRRADAWRLCVAPMMDWTDRHCRYFHRLLAPHARLYTEMVTTGAVLHGDRARLLAFDPAEHPVALQLGGSEPEELARAARIGAEFGFDEINLNCGCPSDRVQKGRFGACLMVEPGRVRDCLVAMREAVAVPVTVKTRTGVDEHDSEEFLHRFVATVAESGVGTVIVHARKAWLNGLSPKENREIPPLDHDRVARLASGFPQLCLVLNGGLESPARALAELARLDGVMLGRAAYRNPWILAELQDALAPGSAPPDREAVVARMAGYADAQLAHGVRFQAVARHMLGLFHGRPGARAWRRMLSRDMHRDDADGALLVAALEAVRRSAPGGADRSRPGRKTASAAAMIRGARGARSGDSVLT
ncbi:MAG: tRNA dihydrouridine(20/20a) synthase DusA [Wenzhouxiangellaceae bacterium]|nr:tRNA dihydrouridine(20/20a) synthase DusA [Wenzhouxiangellaceae bacterium]